MKNSFENKNRRKAYKTAAGCVIAAALPMSAYSTIPLYLVPLSESLGVSIGQVSLLFTFAAVAGLVASLMFGTLLKKLTARVLVCVAGTALAAFFTVIYFADSITMIYLGALLFGFATSTGGAGVAQTVVTWWFVTGRAKIMSLQTVGTGAVSIILAPIIASVLEATGVRQMALMQGLVTGGLMILNAIFLLSEQPSKYDMLPIGYVQETVQTKNADTGTTKREMALGQIFATAPFWLVFAASALLSLSYTGFTNNASAFYQSIGMTAVQASFCISVHNAAKLIWSPVFGTITDKKGPGFATLICGGIAAVTLVASTFIRGYVGGIAIGALMASFAFAGMVGSICYPRIYGAKEAGNLVGFNAAAGSAGAMLGSPIAAFIFDATGSYSSAMLVMAVVAAVAILCTLLATNKKSIARIREKASI